MKMTMAKLQINLNYNHNYIYKLIIQIRTKTVRKTQSDQSVKGKWSISQSTAHTTEQVQNRRTELNLPLLRGTPVNTGSFLEEGRRGCQ